MTCASGSSFALRSRGPSARRLLAATQFLAQPRHQLEAARVQVTRGIELLERLQCRRILAAAHLHFGQRHERSSAFAGRRLLRARQPFVAAFDCVLQVGRPRGHEVIRRGGISFRCGAGQQFLGAAPPAGCEVEQSALGVVTCATLAALHAQRGQASTRSERFDECPRQEIQPDQQQQEHRDRRLEQRAADADRDVTRVVEHEVSEEATAHQRRGDETLPFMAAVTASPRESRAATAARPCRPRARADRRRWPPATRARSGRH